MTFTITKRIMVQALNVLKDLLNIVGGMTL